MTIDKDKLVIREWIAPNMPIGEGDFEPADKFLEVLRQTYEQSGDGCILIMAIHYCAGISYQHPEWLAKAIYAATSLYLSQQVPSMDAALNISLTRGKGQRIRDAKKRSRARFAVFEVKKAIEAGAAKDEALFEEVAERWGIGKTLLKKEFRLSWYGSNDPASPLCARYEFVDDPTAK